VAKLILIDTLSNWTVLSKDYKRNHRDIGAEINVDVLLISLLLKSSLQKRQQEILIIVKVAFLNLTRRNCREFVRRLVVAAFADVAD